MGPTVGDDDARRIARAAASYHLPGAPAPDLGGDLDWALAAHRLEDQRLIGLARAMVASLGLDVGDEIATRLDAAHHRLLIRDMTLERELLAALDEWEIDPSRCRVLKGPAISALDEADPVCRSFGDIDLLVRSEDIDGIVARAIAGGSSRSFAEPRRGFDRRFSKGVNLVRPSQFSIDLHRTLAAGPFGLALDPDELFDGTDVLAVADAELFALDRPRRFLHACYHAVLGSAQPPLVAVRDVVVTMPTDRRQIDEALGLAHRWQAEGVVAAALALVTDRLGVDLSPTPLGRWAARAAIPARQARWLSSTGASRSTPMQTMAGLGAIKRWPDRVRYAAAITFPAGGNRSRRWQRGYSSITRSLRSPSQ